MKAIYRKRMEDFVAALRGQGRRVYGQGQGMLCKRDEYGNPKYDEFCCLGVGTDLWVQAHPRLKKITAEWKDFGTVKGQSEVFPDPVMKWYGITETNPLLPAKPSEYDPDSLATLEPTAAFLNDQRIPFERIADLFEERFLKGGK